MEQIEITSRFLGNLENQIRLLKEQGFVVSLHSRVEDEYMTQNSVPITEENVLDVLAHAVLLRYLKEESQVYKKITFKKKEYLNGEVISEEKYNIPCDDLDTARKLFQALGFKTLVHVRYNVTEMKKGDFRFAFQEVEGLGTLVECESPRDFTGASPDKIREEKQKLFLELKSLGLKLSNETDIKKAKELILKGKDIPCPKN